MTEKNSGPEEAIKGAVEDVKGKAKEAIGTVTGNDSLKREGQAQQDKAEAQREVALKEAEAEKARHLDPTLPEALFETGAAAAETGDSAKANAIWLQLIETYPDSDLAALARANLQRLN